VTLSGAGTVDAIAGIPLERLLSEPQIEPVEVCVNSAALQIAARRFGGQGAARACVVVVRDVTADREAQRVAQQQGRLVAVGQLAAGIAHDFNNILMTIINSAELARRRAHDLEFVDRRLETIASQGERAAALVRQILDFSRQTSPQLQPIDLGQLVRETASLLERTLPETIRIATEIRPGVRHAVSGDPNQLSQVITNLAVNARDAMPLGGALVFAVANEHRDGAGVRPGERGGWVVLTVRDSGTGMPADVRERIFEPFYTTKGPGQGTGLGLSQAYGIIQQHRGVVSVDSVPGCGTTFTIRIPALRGAVTADGGEAAPSLPLGNGETVLVVEDEAAVRAVLGAMLDDLNYRVLVAGTAEEALAIHARHADEVKLVLTDLVMPGVGGLGLLRILKSQVPGLPVVMMSGYLGEKVRHDLEGVAAWVQKPATVSALGSVIHEALAGAS
jgi:signal transduction histidine kinase